ncbi:GrpE, mitochondrial [Hypoxylon texense]
MSLTPAVSKDGFSYAGDLFAEASGHNRHRRATVAELKDHFKAGSEKDHPAHWFEAQLLHYGLPPSKTKAVARMRLFDAVNGGKLAVPAHLKKLEADLKKDWTKNERDAKKALKGGSSTDSPAPVKSAKRKAESENVDLTVNVGGINITVSASNTAKKAKTTSKAATPSKAATKKTIDPKPKTPKAPKTPPVTKPKAKPKAASEPRVKPEPAAPFSSFGSTAAATTPSRPIQTARRGRGWTPGGPPRSSNDGRPRPPYFKAEDSDSDGFGSGYGNGNGNGNGFSNNNNYGGGGGDDETELKPLGLLNGRYEVASDEVASQWGHSDLSLVLTLHGSELWGRFDLGAVRGVLHFERRPYQPSRSAVDFRWRGRGRERDGPVLFGDGNGGGNGGWVRFLGGGLLEGFLDCLGPGLVFRARRLPGQGTRSEVDAREMMAEWGGYGEDEYERESRARW